MVFLHFTSACSNKVHIIAPRPQIEKPKLFLIILTYDPVVNTLEG